MIIRTEVLLIKTIIIARKKYNKTVYCKTGHQILKSTLSPGFRRQRRGSYAREEGKANTGQDSADEVKHTEAGASQVKSRYQATRPESVSSIGKHLERMRYKKTNQRRETTTSNHTTS